MTLAILGLVGFRRLPARGGRLPSMEGETRQADRGAQQITFSDVAGVDEAKAEVREIVDFLKEPARFAALAAASRKASCSSALRAPARRCSPGRLPARPASLPVRQRLGLRRDVRRRRRGACAEAVQGRPQDTARALSSSTSSMPSAARAAASR
jgi:hypothetical protein